MTNADGEPVHIAFPFRRGPDNKIVVDVQDTDEHVMSQVNHVVRYPLGYRTDKRNFGIPYPEFHNVPVDASEIAQEVQRQVPNIAVSYEEYGDIVDAAHRHIIMEIES